MWLQKMNKIDIKKQYDKIVHEIGMLGNFLNLIGAMLSCNFLELQRTQTNKFIELVNECVIQKREPVFTAQLTFDKEGDINLNFILIF